jgi:hypothetical protein
MKLNSYDEFINESIFLEMINEGYIKASSDFIDKLKSIAKQDKIAKMLADGFEKQPYISGDQNQNYIDVTPVEDVVSFISDKKAKSENDPFKAKSRGTIKIGRLISIISRNKDVSPYFFGSYQITPKDIETFVNLYKSSKVETTNQFKLVEGDDIAYWYKEKRYKPGNGQLNSSCMSNVDANYFDIYVKNPKVCKMLIYVNDEDQLLGRALVWKLDKTPLKGVRWFMDRIYTVRDSDINRFKNYARKEGWLYKFRNSCNFEEGVLFYHDSTPVIGKAVVQLAEWDFNEFPFIDTLSFFNKKDGTLSNVGSKKSIILNDTSGGDSGYCEYCIGSGIQEEYNSEKGKYIKIPCDYCVGILDFMIKKINKEGYYPEFKDHLPK